MDEGTIILRAARIAVRQVFRRPTAWREDLVQETALGAVELKAKGVHCSLRVWRMLAVQAGRRVLGDVRFRPQSWDRVALFDVPPDIPATPPRQPERSLALWRLQEAWPFFTDQQKLALTTMLTDGCMRDAARAIGTTGQTLDVARRRALDRVDDPSAFTRVAAVPEELRAQRRAADQAQYRARRHSHSIPTHGDKPGHEGTVISGG